MANPIRDRLLDLPDFGAASADESPDISTLYAPAAHAGALDPERPLVVGGRGVGKSFWSSVLNDQGGREAAAKFYPKLGLETLIVSLGFHENTRGSGSVAPTKRALAQALERADALDIWRAVLLRSLIDAKVLKRKQLTLSEALDFIKEAGDSYDDLLLEADENLTLTKRRFLIVFDALDRLSDDWPVITSLTVGIAKLALEARAFGSIRVKFFMRRDQYDNNDAFRFRDASKLTNARVELFWSKDDLFGWLFQWIWLGAAAPFAALVRTALGLAQTPKAMPDRLRYNELDQRATFAEIAGPYMGSNPRRGMTDRKIVNSIADAFGEASLRSFSAAVKRAAEDSERRGVGGRALDHLAINEGIIRASNIRLQELKEDYGWIELALEPLRGLTVPCERRDVEALWRGEDTVQKISGQSVAAGGGPSTPISFTKGANADALFEAMEAVGVMETRLDSRINVPDLFRVAAGMGRRGGVKVARRA